MTMDAENHQIKKEPAARSGDYLWDRSGEPDPEVQRLEAELGKFRHDRPAPVFPNVAPERTWRFFPWRTRLIPVVVVAAAAIAIAVGALLLQRRTLIPVAGWDVSRLAGTPRVGRTTIRGGETSRLAVGQVVETDHESRASLRAENIGQIEMEPGTSLRLLNMEGFKRIALDRGTIRAYIWATPGQFVVDTPSAVTVDLGCAYTLKVDDSGAGIVRTFLGWVGFKLNGRESFIPAGAACATRPKVGPGTPYFEDASLDLRSALQRFDFEDSTAQQRSQDVATVLGAARKADALTLWHLLSRVDDGDRVLVFNRLQSFVPLPQGVTADGIMRLDRPMLDLWWNQLGFDDISVWRHWERSWSATESVPGTNH